METTSCPKFSDHFPLLFDFITNYDSHFDIPAIKKEIDNPSLSNNKKYKLLEKH